MKIQENDPDGGETDLVVEEGIFCDGEGKRLELSREELVGREGSESVDLVSIVM